MKRGGKAAERDERREMKKRNRDKGRGKMPKKRNGGAVVSVFYCRRICRIDRHCERNERGGRSKTRGGKSDTRPAAFDKIGPIESPKNNLRVNSLLAKG